jgi:hypothetical protein
VYLWNGSPKFVETKTTMIVKLTQICRVDIECPINGTVSDILDAFRYLHSGWTNFVPTKNHLTTEAILFGSFYILGPSGPIGAHPFNIEQCGHVACLITLRNLWRARFKGSEQFMGHMLTIMVRAVDFSLFFWVI